MRSVLGEATDDEVLLTAGLDRAEPFLVAVRRDGRFITNPPPSTSVHANEFLITLGPEEQLTALGELAGQGG